MKWFVLLLLLIPSAQAYSIGISPEIIYLNQDQGKFILINPNDFPVKYSLNGLIKERGNLEAYGSQHIFFEATTSGNIWVTFHDKSKHLRVKPSLLVEVIHAQPKKGPLLSMFIVLLTIIFLVILKKLVFPIFPANRTGFRDHTPFT